MLREVVKKSLLVLGLVFVTVLLIKSWGEIRTAEINWMLFSSSVFIAVIGNYLVSRLFHVLMAGRSIALSQNLATKMYFMGQVSKYIPGKVWGIAHQMSYVGHKDKLLGVFVANIELMLQLMIIIFVLGLSLAVAELSLILSFGILVFGVVAAWLVLKFDLLLVISRIKILSEKLAVNSLASDSKVGFFVIAKYFSLIAIFYVISNSVMLISIFDFGVEEALSYVAYLSLAWVAGVLIFVVPAGIGVREVVFVWLAGYLGAGVSLEVLAAIALFSRLWQVIQDLAGFGVCMLVSEKKVESVELR